MDTSKIIVRLYLVLLVVSLSILLVWSHFTVYVSQQPAYVIQKNTGPVHWTDSFDVEVEFNVAPLLATGASVVVDIIGSVEVEGTGLRDPSIRNPIVRETIVKYTLYLNGQKAKNATDAICTIGFKGGSSCPGIIVPAKFVKGGSNKLLVHADVESIPHDIGTISFLYSVDKVQVRVQYLDLNGNGSIDGIDLLAFAAVGLLGVLPIVMIGKRLPRIKEN